MVELQIPGEKIIDVECGVNFSIVVCGKKFNPFFNAFSISENKVFSFGHNSSGRLGLGDKDDRITPTEIVSLRGKKILIISLGHTHCFAFCGSIICNI